MKYIDIPGSTRQHMLVYGLPGSGKTQLASELTLAGFNLIWFSLDNGHGTIFDKLPLEARSRIDLCNMPDTDSYPISAVMLPRIFSDKSITLCYRHAHPACKICTDGFDTYDLSQHTTSDTIYMVVELLAKTYLFYF